MTKKFISKMFFSDITKNSNLEILTKNLVLNNKMGLKMENFNIFEFD